MKLEWDVSGLASLRLVRMSKSRYKTSFVGVVVKKSLFSQAKLASTS